MKDAGLTSIFHPWKLHLAYNSLFPSQVLLPEPPILIQNDNNNVYDKWEILDIIDCCKMRKYEIQYKIMYIDN